MRRRLGGLSSGSAGKVLSVGRGVSLAALFGALTAPATAEIITMDFNEPLTFAQAHPGFSPLDGLGPYVPYDEKGFEITAIFDHPAVMAYDIIGGSSCLFGQCTPDGTNFFAISGLGSNGDLIHFRLDFFGQPFSLLSLDRTQLLFTEITSSKGGVVGVDNRGFQGIPGGETIAFAGSEWRDLEWVDFLGGDPADPLGFDNIRLQIPEPATLALLGLAFAGIGFTRRCKLTVRDQKNLERR